MSVLLFGVSHRSAPVSVLEQLSTDESDQAKIVDQVLQSSLVTEAMVLSTCNRVEVYAVVEAFHGGLSVIGQVLSEHSGMGARRPHQIRLRAVCRGGRRASVRRRQRPGLGGHRRTAGARPGASCLRAPPRPTTPSAGPCTNWRSAPCRSASGCTPRPASTPRALRWCRSRSAWPTASWTGWPGRTRRRRRGGRDGRAVRRSIWSRAGVERVHIVNRTLPRAKQSRRQDPRTRCRRRCVPVRPPDRPC